MAFVVDILGAHPWQRQADILRALAREPRVTVRSCNGAGKTLCAAWAVLWFLYTRPGAIVVTTAPTKNQVVNLLWRRLRGAFGEAQRPLPGRCLTALLEVSTEWYAMGLATDEEVNFQGPHSPAGVLMVGDEASGLKEWMYHAMDGSMTERGAKQLLIGNPNVASGTFFESHRTWPVEQRFHISAFDVPEHVLDPDWKERMLHDVGKESPVYQVRVLGNFPPQGPDSLFSMLDVEAAQQRDLFPDGPLEFGMDVAEEGGDESYVYARRGKKIVAAEGWHGYDPLQSAGRLIALYNRLAVADEPTLIKLDDIGIGSGTKAQLALHFKDKKHVQVVGVNVGETAWNTENYANRRAEIFFGLAKRFQNGEVDIPAADHILQDQLTQLKYLHTEKGQLKIESKKDMRKRRGGEHGWKSPDRGDALAICFCAVRRRPIATAGVGIARPIGERR